MTDTPTPAQQLEEVLAIADQHQRRADDAGQVSRAIVHLGPTLRRALDALKAVEWRPIETAPKDETVLVFDSWHAPRYSIGGVYKFTYATHWMPLPAPPADAVEVSRG